MISNTCSNDTPIVSRFLSDAGGTHSHSSSIERLFEDGTI
jgi:hypothetical protein